jgi:hypothetical protein
MKKRDLKLLKLRKSSISNLGNAVKGGNPIQITKIEVCGSQIDACPSALACTFLNNCGSLNNKCETFNYPCQSLVECS